jgi:hypothetical protein
VLFTVELHYQFCGGTVEIGDVWTDRLLSSKAHATDVLAPQERPQLAFRLGRIRAELARKAALELCATFGPRLVLWHAPPRNFRARMIKP